MVTPNSEAISKATLPGLDYTSTFYNGRMAYTEAETFCPQPNDKPPSAHSKNAYPTVRISYASEVGYTVIPNNISLSPDMHVLQTL